MSEELDAPLRSRLRAAADSPTKARVTLDELRPAMRRARRRHHAFVGALTVGTVGLSAVGAVVVGSALQTPDATSVVTSDGDPLPQVPDNGSAPTSTTVPSTTDLEIRVASDTSPSDPATTTTLVVGPLPTVPPITTTPPRPVTTAPLGTSPNATGAAPQPPAAAATTVPEPATAPPPTTTSPSTTTTDPSSSGQRAVSTSCGSATIDYDVTTVDLVAVNAASGFSADVKNDGPEEVEVSFTDQDRDCEIHARMSSGRLVVEVEDTGA